MHISACVSGCMCMYVTVSPFTVDTSVHRRLMVCVTGWHSSNSSNLSNSFSLGTASMLTICGMYT